MILTLSTTFSSAHFYAQKEWSEEQNQKNFGRCYTPYGHGHNYKLEVGFKMSGLLDLEKRNFYQETLKVLTSPLDHEHLNFVIPEFKDKVPTTENISLYLLEKLKLSIDEKQISYLRLYEMDNLWTEIRL
ncbi:6-carboxytetrahydropterin synthase [Bdellovibrio bacteriovorus]